MNNSTIYVGMDVHKESFSLCAYTIESDKCSYHQKTEADYKKVLKYLEYLRSVYGDDAKFVCGYEAGCLGYSLYHQLMNHNVNCTILAPTTMLEQRSRKRVKTDKRDAEIIARCLAQHNYSPVHIPTQQDEEMIDMLEVDSYQGIIDDYYSFWEGEDNFCFYIGEADLDKIIAFFNFSESDYDIDEIVKKLVLTASGIEKFEELTETVYAGEGESTAHSSKDYD